MTIHEIETHDGIDFIVMEYVAGQSLDALIPRGGMPIIQALRIGVQVAERLRRAHSAGIGRAKAFSCFCRLRRESGRHPAPP
jgi:hypothetical protein